jgi:biopolymer transport protein ExbD
MATGLSTRAHGGTITGINVTPLVDVTLVLLIVFIVTAKVIVRHQALRVDLPKAASGETIQQVFSVVLAADGSVQVDGQVVPDDDAVLPRARSALRADRELRAAIQADGAVPHRRVMHVLDLLKQAGVAKIGFGVLPATAPAASSQSYDWPRTMPIEAP